MRSVRDRRDREYNETWDTRETAETEIRMSYEKQERQKRQRIKWVMRNGRDRGVWQKNESWETVETEEKEKRMRHEKQPERKYRKWRNESWETREIGENYKRMSPVLTKRRDKRDREKYETCVRHGKDKEDEEEGWDRRYRRDGRDRVIKMSYLCVSLENSQGSSKLHQKYLKLSTLSKRDGCNCHGWYRTQSHENLTLKVGAGNMDLAKNGINQKTSL